MNASLFVMAGLAAAYLVWVVWCLSVTGRGNVRDDTEDDDMEGRKRRGDIVGASRFVLPERLSKPQTTTEFENGKGIENRFIFAKATIPEHPRQIPPEELDEVFGYPPDGVENNPLDIDFPLYESFPDERIEEPEYDDDESEGEPIPGRTLAQGVSFEQMGEVYRRVALDQTITDEQKVETGRILSQIEGTDVFEAIVSGRIDGRDRVKELMDAYLRSFQEKMSRSDEESQSPLGKVPPDFDVRNFV